MPIYTSDGKILASGGKVAASETCCCGATPCSFCDSGTTPNTLDITLSGIADEVCTCTTFDGLYANIQQESECSWRFDGIVFEPCPGDSGSYNYTVNAQIVDSGANRVFRVNLSFLYSGGSYTARWEYILGSSGSSVDCFVSGAVATFTTEFGTSTTRCDPSSSTATITANA